MADDEKKPRRVARADPKTGHVRVRGSVGARKKRPEEGDAPSREADGPSRPPIPRAVASAPPPQRTEPKPLTVDEPAQEPRPLRRIPKPQPPEKPTPAAPPAPEPEASKPSEGPPAPSRRRVLKAGPPPAPAETPPEGPGPAPATERPVRRVPRPTPVEEPDELPPPRPIPEPVRRPGPTSAPTAEPRRRLPRPDDVAPVRAPDTPSTYRKEVAAATWKDTKEPSSREDLMKAMRRQSRIRTRQDEAEAQRLEKEAKALMKKAKDREKFERDLTRHQRYVESLGQELGLDPRRPVTEAPPLGEGLREVEQDSFSGGFARIRLAYDTRMRRYLYEVLEPRLTETEKEARDFLRDTLIRTLDGRKAGTEDWAEYLIGAIHEAIRDHSVLLDAISTQRVQYHLLRDFLGYGPIDVLMQDPMIEDISCDGPGIPIYLFHRQYESLRTNIVFESEEELDAFVIRLAQMSGKHISIADPLLDATLPDGSRLQSTLSKEVTTRGSSFTIRKFRGDPLTPPDLTHLGTMSPEMAGYFWFLMEHGMSLVLAGGTASGKTTSLNAVCQFIPPQKKVVSIEDTREINLEHENWIAGVTRSGFGGETMAGRKSGTIDMYDLLEAALRQRPEFLLVGEVRGPEALTLFQAMATGHAVYSTMHADSVTSAVYRLENEPINVPRMMLQTVDAIAVQQQVRMGDKMTRRITEVTEVVDFEAESGDLLTNTVFEWDVAEDHHTYTGKSYVLEQVMSLENMTEAEVEEEWANRVRVIEWMLHKGIRRYDQVAQTVAHYYRDPADLLTQIAADEAALGYRVHTEDLHIGPAKGAVDHIPEEPPAEAGDPVAPGPDAGEEE